MNSDMHLAHALSTALREGRVEPHFQPIVSLTDRRVLGFEVLARWCDPLRGAIPPSEFIPIADRHDLLNLLLDKLMRAAFRAAADWPHHLFLGFNVSPTQLHDQALASRVARAAEECGFALTRVHIEVTESAFIDDVSSSRQTLDSLMELGCMIAMDDFGTGYSSLTWLSTLPFSKIKIDGQFIRAMVDHRQSRKIVAAVISLGQSLGLAVVAEGVEEDAQADLLQRMGCQLAQGYLFSRPVPAERVQDLLGADETVEDSVTSKEPMSVELRAFQLSALYNSDQTSIAFTDPSGTVVASSTAFDTMMDAAGRNVTGRRIWEIINVTSETLAELRAIDLLGGTFPAFEETTPSGVRALIMIRPVKDESGELQGYSVVCIDVSIRTPSSRAMPEAAPIDPPTGASGAQFSWQLDRSGLVIAIDDSTALTNVKLDIAVGTGWVDFVHPLDIAQVLKARTHAASTGEPYDVDLRLQTVDGDFQWFHTHTAPEVDADGRVVRWRGYCELVEAYDDVRSHGSVTFPVVGHALDALPSGS